MMSNKRVGAILVILGPVLIFAYIAGVYKFPFFVMQMTDILAALGVFGLLTWIGYTMITEPTTPETSGSVSSEDLMPETINPKGDIDVPTLGSKFSVVVDSSIGKGTVVRDHVNLYKCRIGRDCKIESFVYIEEGVIVGDGCKIKPHVFIPSGVLIEDDVFIGPNATFTNDKYPKTTGDWKLLKTTIGRGSSIGAGVIILPGVTIGKECIIGAGSVVTKDVPNGSIVYGNPARLISKSLIKN